MAAKKVYTIRLKFNDDNMPIMKTTCRLELTAVSIVKSWSQKFASIKCIDFFTPIGDKICFDKAGNYIFTVSADVCNQLNLKA
jgi:hypothetical protein